MKKKEIVVCLRDIKAYAKLGMKTDICTNVDHVEFQMLDHIGTCI